MHGGRCLYCLSFERIITYKMMIPLRILFFTITIDPQTCCFTIAVNSQTLCFFLPGTSRVLVARCGVSLEVLRALCPDVLRPFPPKQSPERFERLE